MPRYNLRSSKAVASSPQVSETRARQEVTRTSSSATSSQDELPAEKTKVTKSVTSTQIEPPAKKSKVSMCRRRVARRSRKKNSLPRPSSYTIYDLPPGMITSSSCISFFPKNLTNVLQNTTKGGNFYAKLLNIQVFKVCYLKMI